MVFIYGYEEGLDEILIQCSVNVLGVSVQKLTKEISWL